jgi:mono/diheme cytochrome c family protein
MKTNNFFILLCGAFCLILLTTFCTNTNQKANENEPATATSGEDIVKRGEYLVTIMGCHDCHSPKKMGPNGPEIIPELMLSGAQANNPMVKYDTAWTNKGFAIFYPDLTSSAGPWGVSFAGNLTPDPTGIGTWTEAQFKNALTQGKFKGIDGGRMLLPPMPWFNFTEMKDEDIKAIFAYLKSINPVKNVVPAPVPPGHM